MYLFDTTSILLYLVHNNLLLTDAKIYKEILCFNSAWAKITANELLPSVVCHYSFIHFVICSCKTVQGNGTKLGRNKSIHLMTRFRLVHTMYKIHRPRRWGGGWGLLGTSPGDQRLTWTHCNVEN